MRALGLVLCGLLLAACTNPVGGVSSSGTPQPSVVSAAAALGDLRTIDYCTLLDTSDGDTKPLSSFERCGTEVSGLRLEVGPLTDGEDTAHEPYDYAGDVPPGIQVQQDAWKLPTACVRWVGFADDVWLLVSVLDVGGPPYDEPDTYCEIADDGVAGVLAAITDRRVGHVSYGPDSFGGVDPCAVLGGPELTGGPPTASPGGHDCANEVVGLSFSVSEPSSFPKETLGGWQAAVEPITDACHVYLERPLPGEPRYVERATVTVHAAGDKACADARATAELVIPKLPQ